MEPDNPEATMGAGRAPPGALNQESARPENSNPDCIIEETSA